MPGLLLGLGCGKIIDTASVFRNEQSESIVICKMIEVSRGAKETPERNEYVLFCTFLDLINVPDHFL